MQEVSCLKEKIAESKQDIFIIEEYMKNNLKRDTPQNTSTDAKTYSRLDSSKEYSIRRHGSRNILTRRTPGKLFPSKLSVKL